MSLGRVPHPEYGKPFHWWGNAWQPRFPVTLKELIDRNVLAEDEAALLVRALDEGKSLAVVSDASGAGKSTLLWALAESIRQDVSRIYVRGQYEPFAFSRLASIGSPPFLLMINEVSPYLPVYCWGRVRDRIFGPEFSHIQKVATVHAPSLDAFFDNWGSRGGFAATCAEPPFDVAVLLGRHVSSALPFRVIDFKSMG